MSIKCLKKSNLFLLFVFIVCIIFCQGSSLAAGFEMLKRGHFIIYHKNRNAANNLSWKAEYHYKRIVSHFGIRSFKPWEGKEKCPIYLFPSKEEYVQATGAPEWSGGVAMYKPFRFCCFEGGVGLEEDILPHEMAHMLIHLFMDSKPIPLWLNEGMAQFEEESQKSRYDRKQEIKYYVKEGGYIPFDVLFKMRGVPPDNVSLFYAESASIVDHLISDNIRTNFGRFLTGIKSGKSVEASLKTAYQWKYKNGISDLEKRWKEFLKRKY